SSSALPITERHEQANRSNLQRLLLPSRRPMRPPRRDDLPHLPPLLGRTARAPAAAAPRAALARDSRRARRRLSARVRSHRALPAPAPLRHGPDPGELAAASLPAPDR